MKIGFITDENYKIPEGSYVSTRTFFLSKTFDKQHLIENFDDEIVFKFDVPFKRGILNQVSRQIDYNYVTIIYKNYPTLNLDSFEKDSVTLYLFFEYQLVASALPLNTSYRADIGLFNKLTQDDRKRLPREVCLSIMKKSFSTVDGVQRVLDSINSLPYFCKFNTDLSETDSHFKIPSIENKTKPLGFFDFALSTLIVGLTSKLLNTKYSKQLDKGHEDVRKLCL